jgi:hypothetical protein
MCASLRARADERWLFVPAYDTPRADEEVPAAALTAPWERAFEVGIANADGAKLLEAHSSEARALSDEQTERYTDDLDKALDQLAAGRRARGERMLRAVRKLAAPERDWLRRVPERAQKLFDACVFTAHLLAREKQQELAMQRMVDCISSFPGLQSPTHAPELRALIDQARAALEREPHGDLSVRSEGRDGCIVRRARRRSHFPAFQSAPAVCRSSATQVRLGAFMPWK